ncbi:hypothetical protein [Embleya sp. AB8]|uniref:hypothetical protein n=1 Tax=Embleya sp. AB8 TaxID=3156304 RepID=UPI003C762865
MNPSPGTTDNAALVHERWRARLAPYGDFIVFGDGSLSVMSLMRYAHPDRPDDLRTERWHWWEVLRATAWTPTEWMDVDGMFASCSYAGSRALAGESANHGSYGWVALTRDDVEDTGDTEGTGADRRSLQWLAVSCESNPFAEVTLDNTSVTATSTLGRIWTFPRDNPQQVEITEDPDYPWPG